VNCLPSIESTLRHWLKQANMPLSIHPTDARVKCLTQEQVRRLAVLHGRMLKSDEARPTASPVEISPQAAPQESPHLQTISGAALEKSTSVIVLEERDLSQNLTHLETQVEDLQQHLALLKQELLEAREMQMKRRLSPLDIIIQQTEEQEIVRHESQIACVPIQPNGGQSRVRRLHPAERRAEQRALTLVLPPLIEYGAAGIYVIISSQEGELHLIPDSPEWFDWFKTLSSFRGCRENVVALGYVVGTNIVQRAPRSCPSYHSSARLQALPRLE